MKNKLTLEQIFNDPETMEAVGHYIRNGIIDEAYGRLRSEGKSHEEAMIGARREAGMKVKPGTKVGPESYANAMTAKEYRDRQQPKRTQRQVSKPSNQKRMAGLVLASVLGTGSASIIIANLLNRNAPESVNRAST